MNWIILGVAVASIAFVVGYFLDFFIGKQFLSGISVAAFAIIFYFLGVSLILFFSKYNYDTIEYEDTSTETYEIAMIDEEKYYSSTSFASLNYVTVVIKDENGLYEKKTYETKSLKINPCTEDKATVQITRAKPVAMKLFNELKSVETLKDNYWIDITDEEIISEIIINISKEAATIPEEAQSEETNKEMQQSRFFCFNCGELIKEEWAFCTKCGNKIED